MSGVIGRRAGDKPIATGSDLASYLLHEARVAVVPGEPFGSPNNLRLSYATGMDAIRKGLDRMEAALQKLT
jgi:aspartate aminotransferase